MGYQQYVKYKKSTTRQYDEGNKKYYFYFFKVYVWLNGSNEFYADSNGNTEFNSESFVPTISTVKYYQYVNRNPVFKDGYFNNYLEVILVNTSSARIKVGSTNVDIAKRLLQLENSSENGQNIAVGDYICPILDSVTFQWKTTEYENYGPAQVTNIVGNTIVFGTKSADKSVFDMQGFSEIFIGDYCQIVHLSGRTWTFNYLQDRDYQCYIPSGTYVISSLGSAYVYLYTDPTSDTYKIDLDDFEANSSYSTYGAVQKNDTITVRNSPGVISNTYVMVPVGKYSILSFNSTSATLKAIEFSDYTTLLSQYTGAIISGGSFVAGSQYHIYVRQSYAFTATVLEGGYFTNSNVTYTIAYYTASSGVVTLTNGWTLKYSDFTGSIASGRIPMYGDTVKVTVETAFVPTAYSTAMSNSTFTTGSRYIVTSISNSQYFSAKHKDTNVVYNNIPKSWFINYSSVIVGDYLDFDTPSIWMCDRAYLFATLDNEDVKITGYNQNTGIITLENGTTIPKSYINNGVFVIGDYVQPSLTTISNALVGGRYTVEQEYYLAEDGNYVYVQLVSSSGNRSRLFWEEFKLIFGEYAIRTKTYTLSAGKTCYYFTDSSGNYYSQNGSSYTMWTSGSQGMTTLTKQTCNKYSSRYMHFTNITTSSTNGYFNASFRYFRYSTGSDSYPASELYEVATYIICSTSKYELPITVSDSNYNVKYPVRRSATYYSGSNGKYYWKFEDVIYEFSTTYSPAWYYRGSGGDDNDTPIIETDDPFS